MSLTGAKAAALSLNYPVLPMRTSVFIFHRIYLHAVKQLLAFILLISHINFSMFIAQVDEVDAFDHTGRQLADINSLIQLISFSAETARHNDYRDSDDDNARYFHLERPGNLLFVQELLSFKKSKTGSGATTYPDPAPERIVSSLSETFSPPPETLSI